MDIILFNAMLSKIQNEILENSNKINELNKIDLKYSKIKPEIKKLIQIIENYKNKKIKKISKKLTIFCNGNPYIVLNLFMIAICSNISMDINIDDIAIGVNTTLLEIINKILEKNNINIKINILKNSEIKNLSANNLIFIDRINDYNILKNNYKNLTHLTGKACGDGALEPCCFRNKNIKFIPYQGIDVFCDDDEYEELFDKIYKYAFEMNIDIDVFDKDEGIESILKFGKRKKSITPYKKGSNTR